MIFQQLFDPTSSTFTYVLAQRPGGRALIIDPVFEHVDTYMSLFRRLRLKLAKAVDTHVHADHITALGALRDLTRCVTVMGEHSSADVVSMRLRDGDPVEVDGLELRAMYTPGHTDDSYCFVMADRVFTGDTLLIGGTGRTDFQNGDSIAAWHSLFEKLLQLPDDTLVFPAHDYNGNAVSTIGYERAHNPRLRVKSAQEYAQLMGSLRLADPKLMDVAVPANRSVGRSIRKFLRPGDDLPAADCLRDFRKAPLLLVDLREDSERQRDGAIPGSMHMPYGDFEHQLGTDSRLRQLAREHPQRVVFYCAFGERSALALHSAREAGIEGLRHLEGGMAAWLRAGGEVEFGK
jgi:glyoxylase-like metal-dependent hydrolase (beta-lactamase superfamily II)/rhodanese-related sulfurtransferase